MLVVAVFSLVIFYWAQRTKLPAEEMQALVEQQAERMGTVPRDRSRRVMRGPAGSGNGFRPSFDQLERHSRLSD